MNNRRITSASLTVLGLFLAGNLAIAQEILVDSSVLDRALEVVDQKMNTSQQQQEEITRLANEASTTFEQFQRENDTLEALLVLNAVWRQRIARQERNIAELDESIANVEIITREIPLLTQKMLASIEEFIELDMPFRIDQRRSQVAFARDAITNPAVSIAERFRQVLVLYQSEISAGRTNETYADTITLGGAERDVNIVRIGRVALIAQTTDRQITAAWDNSTRSWAELPAGEYRTAIQRAIRIAQQLDAPDIIELPVKAPETAL